MIRGKTTDATTGEALPFVNIYIKGTTKGTITDFEGRYTLSLDVAPDSLTASYIGFTPKTRALKATEQGYNLNFQLQSNELNLNEVVIRPGENPAWPIMREVIARKDAHDKRKLDAYEFESYNKVEIDVANLSNKLAKNKLIKKIKSVMDSIQILAGDDGQPVLPIFISESISKNYYRRDPQLKKEFIEKTKLTGVGIDDGSVVSQLIGTSFQEYNFYRNWLNIFDKYFVSPIADGWKFYYEYELKDSLMVGNDFCYRIEYWPKRPQDLAFNGTIWITKNEFALRQIDAVVGKESNINFIERVKIQQELAATDAGAWLPIKNRVVVNVAKVQKNWAGMVAKFYTSSKDIVVNRPKDPNFYLVPVEVAKDAKNASAEYWDTVRHDPLTVTEQNVYRMIDTVRKLPVVKSYVEIANIAVNGYKRVDIIDLGPLLYTYAFNNVEGHRFRVGGRTNINFSRRFVFQGYGAYGTRDDRFKYDVMADWIISRRRWTVVGVDQKDDLEQLALIGNSIADNSLFFAFTRFGRLTRSRPFYQRTSNFHFSSEVRKGFTVTAQFDHRNLQFDPQYFDFKYYIRQGDAVVDSGTNFTVSEARIDLKVAPDETFLQNENTRISLGAYKWPIMTFSYSRGIKGLLNSNFQYDKFAFTAVQYINFGYLGRGRYALNAGLIPAKDLAYPLLRVHLGNQTPFYNGSSFNLMDYFEFVSDRWIQLNYQHYFEGLFVNSLPVVRKWNLRLLATGNILMGELSKNNSRTSFKEDLNSVSTVPRFRSLDRRPYMEVGYGVENIFRLLRVDFVHRLTYLERASGHKPNSFGVKLSLQFKI